METLRHDLAYSLRLLAKNPGFTIVAILSLAIGIGATSAVFSVTNSLILRPLPYRDADRLVILWNRSPGLNIAQDWFSPAQYHDVKTQNHVFEETAITIGGSFNMTGQGAPERVDVLASRLRSFRYWVRKPPWAASSRMTKMSREKLRL